MEMVQIYSETFDLCLMQFCDFEWIQLENWKKKNEFTWQIEKKRIFGKFSRF